MSPQINRAAWLLEPGKPLKVDAADLPVPGAGELVVKNAAVAINPLDCHMQDSGVFVQQWPAIFGCDVAGTVHQVGESVHMFNPGDRVIGHTINLVTGRPQDGAYALYTVLKADKAAILPDAIPCTEGVVVPFAFEAAICALSLKEAGVAMPGVSTPALGLPYPSLDASPPNPKKTLVVYGGSSSVGSMTTQIASAAGIHVISIVGAHNFALSKQSGAAVVIDHKDASVVEKVIEAVKASGNTFIGIFDAISTPETYERNLSILAAFDGGHLACVHPPPSEVPSNVQAGMIFAVNDIAAPVWKDYVTLALKSGKLKCLPPPTIVGKGLEYVDEALKRSKAGVSGTKLVVEL